MKLSWWAAAVVTVGGLGACESDPLEAPREADPPALTLACPGGCPEGQKCHLADGRCIFAGIATCDACAAGAQCSPLYPAPTCVDGTCTAPSKFGEGVVKLVSITVAPTERSCDLDGDGQPDNRFASLLGQVDLDAELTKAIADDRVTMMLEPTQPGWGEDGGKLDAALWFGTLSPQSKKCSTTSEEALCTYTVSRDSYDPATLAPSCATWLNFRGLTRSGAQLASPPAVSTLDMVVPVGKGGWLLQLAGARLDATVGEAQVQGPGLGPRLAGRLCGAVPKADLLLAVDALPVETIAKFGGPVVVKSIVDGVVKPDVDADRDGAPDSVSMAFEWVAVPARIVGYSPEP